MTLAEYFETLAKWLRDNPEYGRLPVVAYDEDHALGPPLWPSPAYRDEHDRLDFDLTEKTANVILIL